MVRIQTELFAEKVSEHIRNPASSDQHDIEATLNLTYWKGGRRDPKTKQRWLLKVDSGIRFASNTTLVMKLLEMAYRSLTDGTDVQTYSNAVAKSVEKFATPFPDGDNLVYPHFLLHGLYQNTMNGIVAKIDDNSRIIHETLGEGGHFIARHPKSHLEYGLVAGFDYGHTEDYFGIAFCIWKKDGKTKQAIGNYAAKNSFFLDTTNRELVVITVQGPKATHRFSSEGERIYKGGRGSDFGRLSSELGMDPRAFTLVKLSELAAEEGYKKIKVIRPSYHPMLIEEHKGFFGRYEPVIRQAGIQTENGCYLEKILNI